MRDRTPDGVGSEAGEAATPAFAADDGPDTPTVFGRFLEMSSGFYSQNGSSVNRRATSLHSTFSFEKNRFPGDPQKHFRNSFKPFLQQ